MNKRKIFGTILGIVFWSACIVFFTFAYYEWKSTDTNVTLAIKDLSVECLPGPNINVTNIGPVLNYQDGVKSEFTINNESSQEMAIDLRLDITYISSNLLTKSFKYAVVTDTTGNTNYDYDNPVIMGSFTNFIVGSNILTTALSVEAETEQKFLFIVYIDGNMKNDTNMQDNSLEANLMIGNCEENVTPLDELVYQAIYSETDNSLTFLHTEPLTVGDTYNEKLVTKVYTGFETANYSSSAVPWYSDSNYLNITTVNFDSIIKPISTAYWFNGMTNLVSINLDKLDTSNVTNMYAMFRNCSSLTSLDVSNFDTSKVTRMNYLFKGLAKITELDLSNFNTSKVTDMYEMFRGMTSLTSLNVSGFDMGSATFINNMFRECSSLEYLDLSNWNIIKVTSMESMFRDMSSLVSLDLSGWNTSNVEIMECMFFGCGSLVSLDVSHFNTSKVTNMSAMFYGCSSLTSIDVSNFDTSKVTNMGTMFRDMSSLVSLDLSNFNTSKVTNMTGMFEHMENLVSLDISNFDTSNVTNMSRMFAYMSYLKNLNLGTFDTSKVTDMTKMFWNCFRLTTAITIRNSNITYTSMFEYAAYSSYGAKITVNYTSATSILVDSMITAKSSNSNVIKGSLVS